MHPSAYHFCVRALLASGIAGKHILEIGSLDVNSSEQGLSLRDLCAVAASYTGIDEQIGLGVDIVVSAADYQVEEIYDIVITTEALEHTPAPCDIIECARRSLRPGGLLIVTAAGPSRQPHNCDGTPWSGVEHYANIEPEQLRAWLAEGEWEGIRIEHNTDMHDVYATAIRG